jgi:hypothetical protein
MTSTSTVGVVVLRRVVCITLNDPSSSADWQWFILLIYSFDLFWRTFGFVASWLGTRRGAVLRLVMVAQLLAAGAATSTLLRAVRASARPNHAPGSRCSRRASHSAMVIHGGGKMSAHVVIGALQF